MSVQRWVGCSKSELSTIEIQSYLAPLCSNLHQVLASGSSMAGSTFLKLTLRMKP